MYNIAIVPPSFKASIVIDMLIISLDSYIFNKQTYLHTKLILYNKINLKLHAATPYALFMLKLLKLVLLSSCEEQKITKYAKPYSNKK